MCQRVETAMPCQPASVRAARRWVAENLAAMYGVPGGTADDAALVVSELVTNCVRADAHGFALVLEAHHDTVLVEARDDAPGTPTPRVADPLASHGRGLMIVARIARDWGVRQESAGKTVWAELAMLENAAPAFVCTRSGG